MNTPTLRSERGIALPLALFGILIIGAIIAALFTMTRMEQRQGQASISTLQAFEAAETGLAGVVANWNVITYNALRVDSVATNPVVTSGLTQYQTSVRKLNNTTFVATSEGRVLGNGGAIRNRRQMVQLLRLIIPDIAINAAVTTRNGISVTGSSQISGHDSIPTGWGSFCPPPTAPLPGIRDSSGNVATSGACSGGSCITGAGGTNSVVTDPTVNTNTFTNYGPLDFNDLAALATKTLTAPLYTSIQPVAVGSVCTTSLITNWGAPRMASTHPCFNYFPIIYAPNDVHLSGGQGQGILLVNGDLEVSGGFEFFGPVIVMGEVQSTGTGGHFYGGVLARDANFSVSLFTGNSVVNYSACALARALQGSSNAEPLDNRSWVAVF